MSKLALGTRAASTVLRALEFAISAIVLGAFSWYLAYLSHHNRPIPRWEKAVEGMSGGAVIYTAFAVILTCFLGGITFFAFLGLLLDVLFCACFVAIAILARGGAKSCGSINNSPIGTGHHVSCNLQRAVFAIAIANAILFLISAALEIVLSRARKREKRYGPSPANNYTSGSGKRKFWKRKNNQNKSHKHEDAELGAVGAGALIAEEKHHHHNNHKDGRISDETAMTGTTAPVADSAYGGPNNKYSQDPTVPSLTHPAHADGYTNQQSLGVTPGSTMPEMGGGGHYTQHVNEPYASVHHGGYIHQEHGVS